MADPFAGAPPSLHSPAFNAAAVTPHDTNALAVTSRGLQVNVAGNVAVRFRDASADVTLTLLAGITYSYVLTHVRSTGTTATGIVALW